MKRWQADLALAVVALIWGSTFVMVKDALDAVGPLMFVGARFTLAVVFMAILFPRQLRGIRRDDLRVGGLIGIWLTAGYIFQTVGLQTTTSAKAGFITGLNIVVIPILTMVLLRRPPGRAPTLGILIAIVGLAFLSLDRNLRVNTGDVWVMGCAVAFALHIVSVSHFSPHHDPIRLTAVQIAVTAVIALIAAPIAGEFTLDLPLKTWGAMAFTGLVATVLAFGIQVYVQRFTTPTHTGLIFSLEPVFAGLFGWWLANESLGIKELIGCGLILAGMLVAEFGTPSGNSDSAMQPIPAASD